MIWTVIREKRCMRTWKIMNNLTPLIYISVFILGMVTGVMITYFGFKLGFRANIEARLLEDEVPESKRLFGDLKEPAEFELLKKQELDNRPEERDDDDV